MILSMGKMPSNRWVILFIFIVFLFALDRLTTTREYVMSLKTLSRNGSNHPIRLLSLEAAENFQSMLQRQSADLQSAEHEYRRRYHRDPPPGFDKWFAYAKKHNSPIIDDYDIIHESMKPFWTMRPRIVRFTAERAGKTDGALCSFQIKDGQSIPCVDTWEVRGHPMDKGMATMIEEFVKDLPDMEILLNEMDEPLVLYTPSSDDGGIILSNPKHRSDKDSARWDALIEPCSGELKAPGPYMVSDIHTYGLPFIQNKSESLDLCKHPEYDSLHRAARKPDGGATYASLVPIWSQGVLSTFSDIIYPSPYYFNKYDAVQGDMPYSEKNNKLYWTGGTTGGFYTRGANYLGMNRHRFVAFANGQLRDTNTFLTKSRAGFWMPRESDEDIRDMFDVRFTSAVQCEDKDGGCEEMKEMLEFGEWAPQAEAYAAKFVMDLDGNSFSGRYYRHLASNSCVFKQSLFREWHDERLIPWVHYVPVSLDLGELPETLRYLTETDEGQVLAESIAQNGQEWTAKSLRTEDASVFLYRLMLEYGRILDENRIG